MSKRAPPQKEETFHKARSRLIDSYARLENRLVYALSQAGLPVKGDSVAAKLKSIRAITASKSNTDHSQIFDRLSELGNFRADLVHSVMILTDVDGERFASFRNAKDAINKIQRPAQVSYTNLKTFAAEIDDLSAKLAELEFTPPSSPLPPSPGAAGGP